MYCIHNAYFLIQEGCEEIFVAFFLLIFITLSQDGAEVARRVHNPEVGGSNPSPATKCRCDGMADIGVLEASGLPRTGSSPVTGTNI